MPSACFTDPRPHKTVWGVDNAAEGKPKASIKRPQTIVDLQRQTFHDGWLLFQALVLLGKALSLGYAELSCRLYPYLLAIYRGPMPRTGLIQLRLYFSIEFELEFPI